MDRGAASAGESPAVPPELVPAMVSIPPALGVSLIVVAVALTLCGVPEAIDGPMEQSQAGST